MPKNSLMMSRSRSVRVANARSISRLSDSLISDLSALGESLFTRTSSRLLSSPSTNGASTDTCLPLTRSVSDTFSFGNSSRSASSSGEGVLSNSCSNLENALFILFKDPT